MEQVAVADGLFALDGVGGGHLIGGACGECGRLHFPATSDCPYCSAEGCQRRPLSTQATLWLFTTVVNRPPGYTGEVPFGFGVVELPEGLRLITRLSAAEPEQLTLAMPMRLCFVPLHVDEHGREVVTYSFAPDAP